MRGTVNVRNVLATISSDKLDWGINTIITQKDLKHILISLCSAIKYLQAMELQCFEVCSTQSFTCFKSC